MAEDTVAENGAADEKPAAAMPLVLVADTDTTPDQPASGDEGSSILAAPQPVAPPMELAGSRKASAISLGASAAAHLLVGLLVFGSFAWPHAAPDVVPVKLIPADQAPPEKPKPPQKQAPPAGQKKAAQPPPKASMEQPPLKKDVPVPPKPEQAHQAPPSAKEQADAPKTPAPWRDLAASLGIADYGHKTALAGKLLAELSAQVSRCWSVPSGWTDPQQVSTTLRFQLNPDGGLEGEPSVVRFPATPMGVAAAKAAITAVTSCGPYRLPKAQYDQWKDVQLTLAP